MTSKQNSYIELQLHYILRIFKLLILREICSPKYKKKRERTGKMIKWIHSEEMRMLIYEEFKINWALPTVLPKILLGEHLNYTVMIGMWRWINFKLLSWLFIINFILFWLIIILDMKEFQMGHIYFTKSLRYLLSSFLEQVNI